MHFQKSRRLRRASEFEAVFAARPWRCVTTHLSLSCLTRPHGTARLGLVIGRRAAKLSVVRNRVKRVLREAFRAQALQLPAMDCVVRAHRPLPSLPEHAFKRLIRAEIDEALLRVMTRYARSPGA